MDDHSWPNRVSCFDRNDNRIVTDTYPKTMLSREFPEGAYCTQECSEHSVHVIWQADRSTCECADGRCNFSDRKMNYCEKGVCDSDVLGIFSEFSLGFDNDYADVRSRI